MKWIIWKYWILLCMRISNFADKSIIRPCCLQNRIFHSSKMAYLYRDNPWIPLNFQCDFISYNLVKSWTQYWYSNFAKYEIRRNLENSAVKKSSNFKSIKIRSIGTPLLGFWESDKYCNKTFLILNQVPTPTVNLFISDYVRTVSTHLIKINVGSASSHWFF